MKVIVLNQYSDDPREALTFSEQPIPTPTDEEVLVEVHAASLNPIDARIRSGYGRSIFEEKASLPIILGRDFSGVIVKVGSAVQDYSVGDEVFGVVSPFRKEGMKHGSHSEFITAPVTEITKKPKNIDHIQAASLPYVALTTYSALITQAGMRHDDYKSLRVLVHAGAGGVGTYAIQFLKALGAYVITTCSTKNVSFLRELGADEVIDYTQEEYSEKLKNCDIAYDLLGHQHTQSTLSILKSITPSSQLIEKMNELYHDSLASLELANASWNVPKYKAILHEFDLGLLQLLSNMPRYLAIVGPMMPLTDTHGLHAGMKIFVETTLNEKFNQAKEKGRFFNYSFFEPNQKGLAVLAEHIVERKIKPIVGQVFALADFADAHLAIDKGHAKGKIVFNMNLNKATKARLMF